MNAEIVVITGSTRGIGFAMAEAFLRTGHKVVVSGSSTQSVDRALKKLSRWTDNMVGVACNVTEPDDLEGLWQAARNKWGGVDIWINNAGISHSLVPIWETPLGEIEKVVNTNVLGVMYGSSVAMKHMMEQGFGRIYNMEGLGSDGRHATLWNIYGTTKRALSYYTDGLIQEAAGTPVHVGALSSGMVVTDFILDHLSGDRQAIERTKRIYNILGDKPETVSSFLVKRILLDKGHGSHINWLTAPKVIGRFLLAPIRKRQLFEESDDYSRTGLHAKGGSVPS